MALSKLSPNWHVEDTIDSSEEIRLFHVQHHSVNGEEMKSPVMSITKSLIVMRDRSWIVHVNDLLIPASCPAIKDIPKNLSTESFINLLDRLQKCKICIGNPDNYLVSLCEERKGKFLSVKKKL